MFRNTNSLSGRDQLLLAASHLAEPYLREGILSLFMPRKHGMDGMDCTVERAAAEAAPEPPPAVRCCYCGSATKAKKDCQPERLLRKHRLGNSPPKGFSLVTISHTDSTTHAHFVHALQVMDDNAFWTKTRTRRRGTARANAKARTGFMPATMSGSYLHSGCKSRVQKECDKVLPCLSCVSSVTNFT